MLLTQVLEKKSVIQFFGIALILSPLFNFLLKLAFYLNFTHQQLSDVPILSLITSRPISSHVLDVANLVIGILILRGLNKAWSYMLFLLLGYIIEQLSTLRHEFQISKLSIVFPIVNILVFAFIADQLVYKVKVKLKMPTLKKPGSFFTKSLPPPANPPVIRKKVLLYLQDVGNWAQLTEISKNGFQAKGLLTPPQDIEKREIQISMPNGHILRFKMTEQINDRFFFSFLQMSPDDIRLFNEWLGVSNS